MYVAGDGKGVQNVTVPVICDEIQMIFPFGVRFSC